MGSGPLWPIVVDYHSKLCKKHMWKNFFFIHNYFGFENMVKILFYCYFYCFNYCFFVAVFDSHSPIRY